MIIFSCISAICIIENIPFQSCWQPVHHGIHICKCSTHHTNHIRRYISVIRRDTVVNLFANDSTAFKWNIWCHWLNGLLATSHCFVNKQLRTQWQLKRRYKDKLNIKGMQMETHYIPLIQWQIIHVFESNCLAIHFQNVWKWFFFFYSVSKMSSESCRWLMYVELYLLILPAPQLIYPLLDSGHFVI